MTKVDHEAKAREFVDSILKANRQHGAGGAAGVIKYGDAVKAVTETFKRLREGGATPSRRSPRNRHVQKPKSPVCGLLLSPRPSARLISVHPRRVDLLSERVHEVPSIDHLSWETYASASHPQARNPPDGRSRDTRRPPASPCGSG